MNRAAKERVAKMYTVKGSDIIEINEFVDKTFNRTEQIGFEANFDWKIDMAFYPAGFSAKAQKAVSSRIYVEKPVKPSVTTEWAV